MYVITNDATGQEIDTVETEDEAISLVYCLELQSEQRYSYRYEA